MCDYCDDTGSLSKSLDGHMDCTHCDVAEERVNLELWAARLKFESNSTGLWLVYKHGKDSVTTKKE